MTVDQDNRLLALLGSFTGTLDLGKYLDLSQEELVCSIAAAVGRCCSDPALYVPRLLQGLAAWNAFEPPWHASALAAIAMRSRKHLVEHSAELVRRSEELTRFCIDHIRHVAPLQLLAAVSLLGHFGDGSHEALLKSIITRALSEVSVFRDDEAVFEEVIEAAREASALISAREQPRDAAGSADSGEVQETAEVRALAENVIDEGPRVPHEALSPESDAEQEELAEGLRLSEREALEQEQADISEAVLRSKMDAQPSSSAVLARLTFHSAAVFDHLLASEDLEACIAHVENAGCELRPPWANGALLLAPLAESQLASKGLQLKAHHIVVLKSDLKRVDSALRGLPHRKRPQLKLEHREDLGVGVVPAGDGPSDDERWSCESVKSSPEVHLVVERTFWTVPLPKEDVSETWPAVCSMPAEHGDSVQQNPRRWRSSRFSNDAHS